MLDKLEWRVLSAFWERYVLRAREVTRAAGMHVPAAQPRGGLFLDNPQQPEVTCRVTLTYLSVLEHYQRVLVTLCDHSGIS